MKDIYVKFTGIEKAPELRERTIARLKSKVDDYVGRRINLWDRDKYEVYMAEWADQILPDVEETKPLTEKQEQERIFDKVEITVLNELNQNLNNYPWWQALKGEE